MRWRPLLCVNPHLDCAQYRLHMSLAASASEAGLLCDAGRLRLWGGSSKDDGKGGGAPSVPLARAPVAELSEDEQLNEVLSIVKSIDSDQDGRVSYDEIKTAVLTHAFYRLRAGRYTVALSLAEAEAVRVALHAARVRNEPGGRLAEARLTELALRHGSDVLDCTDGFRPGGLVLPAAGDYLGSIARQCFRFIDSELDYEVEASTMLLRALQTNSMASRLAAYAGLRHCRRRPIIAWKHFSIARLFTTEDEYKILHLRAMLSRARVLMRRRRLLPSEFVAMVDRDHDGVVTMSELRTGLRWLGMDISTEHTFELIEHLDPRPPDERTPGLPVRHLLQGIPDVDDGADVEEWEEDDDDGSRTARIRQLAIPQIPDAEFASTATDHQRQLPPSQATVAGGAFTAERLSHIRVRVVAVRAGEFTKLWDTVGTMSRARASIWVPQLQPDSMVRVGRESLRVCLGHYASASFEQPTRGRPKGAERGHESLLELTDTQVAATHRMHQNTLRKTSPLPSLTAKRPRHVPELHASPTPAPHSLSPNSKVHGACTCSNRSGECRPTMACSTPLSNTTLFRLSGWHSAGASASRGNGRRAHCLCVWHDPTNYIPTILAMAASLPGFQSQHRAHIAQPPSKRLQ